MKKNIFLGSSILYKRPISKVKSSYNSNAPNSTTNKQIKSLNFTEDEHLSNHNLVSSVRSDVNKIKKENSSNYKKININYPLSNSSRISVNNIINKNRLKKNIISINDNSSYYHDKDNENSKIFQNYNNNTCNISLNQHFYNIDYNANLKNDIDISKNKEFKNMNINSSKEKQFPSFYLNSLNNSVPIYYNKNINNNNLDTDNQSNALLLTNIIPKIKKEANKISIININGNKNKFLKYNNGGSNLNNYTNFVKFLNHNKNINNKNMHKTKSTSINSFKYKKKIITYNSFVKKKDNNDSTNSNLNIKENNNYSHFMTIANKSVEKNNNSDIKSTRVKGEYSKDYNKLIINKINMINHKKLLNLNNLNNCNNSQKERKYENLYHTTKNNYNNKKITYYLHKENMNKQKESNCSLDKSQGNSSLPIIDYAFNKYNNYMSNKINLKMNRIYQNNTINNDSIGKYSNNSLFKLNNTNNNINNKYPTIKNDNSTIETKDKFNYTKIKKNNESYNFCHEKKSFNSLIKNKNIINFNYNQNNHDYGMKNKKSIFLSKGQNKISNLKNCFLNRFPNNINNEITPQEKLKLNKKNKLNYNYKTNKKKSKNDIGSENPAFINNSLSELIIKFRQTKNKETKNNKYIDKKSFKGNFLNKKFSYVVNQSNSVNNLKYNSAFLKVNEIKDKQKNQKDNHYTPNISSASTKGKESNEFMEQSLKLSKYIKDYYYKYNNYPQTNLNFYRIGRIIGQGGFAKVNLGLNVLTGRVVAIKSFNKTIKTKYGDNLNMDKILYEINLMRKLNHPNITKILETFEDDKFYFIIMEYINGGNLFSYVKKRRKLSEKVSKFLFRQIILGIKHIHSQLIVHRDIKLENILIDMNNKVKICDFGIGIILSSENKDLYSHCGTPLYIAPEIITSTKEKGYKGFPVDIWSAGIALYIMLSGKLPFNLDEDQDDIDGYNNNNGKQKNAKLKYEIVHKEPKYLENISDEARDLLRGLLNKNPKKRLTCDQILNHPWFSDINYNKNHLFSKAEKENLSKTYIDYRKNKLDDLVENFTLSNLFNDKKNSNIEYNNIESKSSLLAPFNSLNFEFFNISNENLNINKKDEFDDFYNKKLIIEKDLLAYSNKAKELNNQYEINNNKDVDNGVLINTKSMAASTSSSFSNTNTFRNNNDKNNQFEYDYRGIDYINKEKLERILNQMNSMGYERDYIIKSVKNNYLNHASTVFFLLMQYENI